MADLILRYHCIYIAWKAFLWVERRVDFRSIELRRSGSENLSSIGSRSVEMCVRSWVIRHLISFWSQVRDGGLIVASRPGVFSSGIRPRRFEWEGSAARRPLVDRCDVPEEFIGALVCDVVAASDGLDEFLYGFAADDASNDVI
ncbi:hypothetical protein EVAR_20772_1 [Eumeta japonica]|uniref:Uncharacterized protein n=1 Tax=Eumeta variegata TaxID=151549 RepID=A0A4C1UDJ4_EUMVA|nr:hypothetical protein EVAR_20772_1 [Eumeta japonica]